MPEALWIREHRGSCRTPKARDDKSNSGEKSPHEEMRFLQQGLSARGVARLRAATRQEALSASYTREQAARHLLVDVCELTKVTGGGAVLAFRARGSTFYLRWQFTERGELLPYLKEIIAGIPSALSIFTINGVMTTPQPALRIRGRPDTPRDWLIHGHDPDAVLDRFQSLLVG